MQGKIKIAEVKVRMLILVEYCNAVRRLRKLPALIHGIAWGLKDTFSHVIMPPSNGSEVRRVNSKLFPKKIFAAIPNKLLPMDPFFKKASHKRANPL